MTGNHAPHDDFSLDEILAEAQTLKEGERPSPKGRAAEPGSAGAQGKPLSSERENESPAAAEEEALPPKKPRRKKRRLPRLFGRRRAEIPEFSEEEDIYYGLQLKTLDEYRKEYEKTISIDAREVRDAQRGSSAFPYLFDQSDLSGDREIEERLNALRGERRRRAEPFLRGADEWPHGPAEAAPQPEPAQPGPSAPKQPEPAPAPKPEIQPGPGRETPAPVREPEAPPRPPRETPPEQPQPAPRPEILPGPQRTPEIPMPLSEPHTAPAPPMVPGPAQTPGIRCGRSAEGSETAPAGGEGETASAVSSGSEIPAAEAPLPERKPEIRLTAPEAPFDAPETPVREKQKTAERTAPAEDGRQQPVSAQAAGEPSASREEMPEEPGGHPVKEPVPPPQVQEEIPPAPPRTEPPEKPVPLSCGAPYRPEQGRPLLVLQLDDFQSVLSAEAARYPVPRPEPIPLKRPEAPAAGKAPAGPPVPERPLPFPPDGSPGGPENPYSPPEQPAGDTDQPPEQPAEPLAFPHLSAARPAAEEPGEKAGEKSSFHVFGSEEEENDVSEEPAPPPEELDDYTSPADAPSVSHELNADVRRLALRSAVTGIAAAALLAAGFLGEMPNLLPPAFRTGLEFSTYLILNLVFLLISCAFSFSTFLSGIRALTKFGANSDSAVSAAALAALLQSAAVLFYPESVERAGVHLYSSLAALALFLNTAGKFVLILRIRRNFRFVASPARKWAVQVFDDHNTALQMARDCVLETPAIAYQNRADFLEHFLRISYETDPSDRMSQMTAPIGFVVSLALCGVSFYLTRDIISALTALAASACVCVPFMNQLSVNLPVGRLSRIAAGCGAMLAGYPAVERFGKVNAVAVDAKDLFPRGTVILNGIRTFSGGRIDEAIMDATALMYEAGGPLSDLFDQIVKGRRDMLPKIENAAYEDGRGVTGWVSGRRILVGNRELMQAHDIEPPSRDYEEKYIRGGRKLIYLASGGELVAMFMVSYHSDRRRALELRRMERNGISLLVRTSDPNITPALLAECFGLEDHTAAVLPDRLGEVYRQLTEAAQERAPALLATKGRSAAMMRVVTACVRQSENISISVALQGVAVALGFVLVAFLTCYAGLSQLTTAALLIYELFWVAAILFVPRIRRP